MVPSLQSIFSTPSSAIGRVEKATSRLLLSPDWMMNMDICSSINADPWKAKSFVKAVRMRLQNKNSKVQFLALTLLETMIKNCDDFVHFQVVDRGILSEMVKIVRKSKNMEVREKILILLESWQETFRGPNGRYPQFYNTYVELKRSGVQFPEQSKNTDMILTLTDPMTTQPQKNYKISTNSIGRLHQVRSETGHFRNDRLLVEALRLNDSLQTLLSKHHSLVSRSSSPPETAPTPPLLSLPPPTPPFLSLPLPTPPTSNQLDNEKEEEDGFFALVKRNSISKSAGVQEVSHRSNELNTINSAEDLTSVADNALVLFDSPAPVSTSNKEENMIDLLSLTLSPNQASQRPPLPPPSLTQSQNPFSYSLGWEHFLSYPQPLMSNESYTVYNDYVAPWARPTAVQSPEIYNLSPHLPSSWNASEGSSNPFL
ncbi:vacuolar protein sorting-associated protein 27-like isoform X2 [Phalaenopsis equestris]|uniref:vacuolar protein sorting-associated protein 27-like isoform X2 n=1 Tax=Phalaenopsis equestris TaxID=78828 RepID=UPI0009E2E63E|nr:vacuolar protein sorting-associated protein 27-like isoform X2 [Phalaenopsis equestris]